VVRGRSFGEASGAETTDRLDPPAARLRHDSEDLWFCSQACLRRFLDGLEESGAVA